MCLLELMPGSARTVRILRELKHPSQKIHDNEVSKVDIWLVVEEVREHQSLMARGMVVGVVFSKVGASGGLQYTR